MVTLNQLGDNIGDVVRGAYHGSVSTAVGLLDISFSSLVEMTTLEEVEPELLNKRLQMIPRSIYGKASAGTAAFATLCLLAFGAYKATSGMMDTWLTMHEPKPSVVYYVDGEVAQKRIFHSQEKMDEYLESEAGRQQEEYFRQLNSD